MKRLIVTLLLFLVAGSAAAQRATVGGVVRSAQTGETLVGAVVAADGKTALTTAADAYGRYALSLPTGTHTLIYSYGGYVNDTLSVELKEHTTVNIELKERTVQVEQIVVSAYSGQARVEQPTMGVERLSTEQLVSMPVIFGEKDILKTAQLLPGVKSSSDGNSGMAVRGGSLDQNLILLDDAPVYNASHLAGFFSTFNATAIKDVAIFKGNYPAQYGGRVASVVDVTMNDGNTKQYVGNAGIGLISSNLSFEGPIQKDRSSFLVSGRRTYMDLFAGLLEQFRGNQLYFYDVNLKANVALGDKNKLYVSGYFGRDVTAIQEVMGLEWGNQTGTVRWASTVSPTLFSNTTFVYSQYNYDARSEQEQLKATMRSQIEDFGLKQDFRWVLGRHALRFGLSSTFHTLTPTRFETGSVINLPFQNARSSWENGLYASFNGRFWDRVGVEAGVRLSSYTMVGGGVYNLYDQGRWTGSVDLGAGQFGKTYFYVEPRASVSVSVGPSTSLKAAYGRNVQYVHMLSSSSVSVPMDQWLGSSYTLPPTVGDQVSVGAFHNFASVGLELSVEGYYKASTGEADYRPGADIYGVADIESQLLMGVGRAYGVEVLLRKTLGRFTGWVGYTWSRTERRIDGINDDRWYPTRQDRTHEVSVVGMYKISDRWEVSAVWCYSTGAATTVPAGKYLIDNRVVYLYSERNGYRMPAYHRLDLGATYTARPKGGLQGSWSFGLYNAYGRENPMLIRFKENKQTGQTQAVALSLFRWVPSVSYSLKFNLSKR